MVVSDAGLITWTPAEAQAGTTNTVEVGVSDGYSPAGSSTRSFVVVVRAISNAPQIAASISDQGQCVLNWNSQAGARYRVHYRNALQAGAAWQTLGETDGTGNALNYTDDTSSGVTTRFYRVEVLP
jgi:hypothetical protein